ncbi:MAG: nucleotidyltransferase domain-containing protein [Eubacterium sp.]|nr:nucleotidyltransferase domain-containing protein [Eubacterium sp.]
MLDVKEKYLKMLTEVFESYCPKAEIWAYGSRVNGDCHSGSDLDLAVKSFGGEKKSVRELRNLISDSNVPFLTDVNEFDRLPKSFQDEIVKSYVIIYPEQKSRDSQKEKPL